LCVFLNTAVRSESSDKIIQLSEELTIEKIREDVYIVNHKFPWSANSMIVRCSDSIFVWVDTPYTDDATEQVLNWVASQFGEIRIVEINTGFHNDNLGGNGCLKQRGLDIYGSDLTVRLLKERSEKTREQILKSLEDPKLKKYYDAHATATYTEPTRLFEIARGLNLKFDGEEIVVYYPGPSHSMDNVVVYFPEKKLLFGGCMVKSINSSHLGFTGDADMMQWPISLKKVLAKYGEARIVVPGHGTFGGIELIKHTLELF
jgi:metallo-beta-lactamase class B